MSAAGQDHGAPYPLRGRSVLLTGASGGIGAALAVELAERGSVLTLLARDVMRLQELPVDGLRLVSDLRTPGACERAVRSAAEHGGGLHALINAAGVVAFGMLAEASEEAVLELFQTNALVPIALARSALGVLSPGGAIVNISGVVADTPLPGMAAYCASKGALRAFDAALARETRRSRSRIRVIDARPPHTDTQLAAHPLEGAPPPLGAGIAPARVAQVICDALEDGSRDLPPESFAMPRR